MKEYSVGDYLELEHVAEACHEYRSGVIFAMAGGSPNHNKISANITRVLGNAVYKRGSCNVFSSDQRIHISSSDAYVYPDVSMICGDLETDTKDRDSIMNPVLIVEVLSKSTAYYDRGEKFLMYQSLDSLMEYILIEQDMAVVFHYKKTSEGSWEIETIVGLDSKLTVLSIDTSIKMEEIYWNVHELNGSFYEPGVEPYYHH